MSDETTRNFLQVMSSFQWPEPKPISYRLYHDTTGRPIMYSMEDMPGDYIEIDATAYALASFDVQVCDGKLINLRPKTKITCLSRDPDSGTSCDPRDVCVVVDDDRPHQKWKNSQYEID